MKQSLVNYKENKQNGSSSVQQWNSDICWKSKLQIIEYVIF